MFVRQISRTIDIAATPEQVWATLTGFTAYGEWSPFIREVSGTAEAGQKLRVAISPAAGKAMTFRPTVIAAQPGRELRWLGRVLVPGLLDGEHSFTLEPFAGGTRLTQAERFSGVLVPLVGTAIDVGDDFDAMNRALRERVEATDTIAR
ncbi:SRPBCC domain-containing protein [Knoellia locipacati]|uniref:SRPBCC family protein n=1 Tax=Knoellia locipacati TaxID=882824 RepID=UPI00384E7020